MTATPNVKPSYMPFRGGLDQVTPSLQAAPGTLRLSQNYEIDLNGGYQTVLGYEIFDGQAKPSGALYYVISVNLTGSIAVGDTITGDSSGASGEVIAVEPSRIAFTKLLSGPFTNAEDISVTATVQAVATSASVANSAGTTILDAKYKNLAADAYRADIAAIPGAGDVIGIMVLSDVKYGVRNAVGEATSAIYKSSTSGWTLVPLGFELPFNSGGTTEIAVGDLIQGGTSGETATVTGVALQSGTWAGGDAVGILTFLTESGTFQSGETVGVGAADHGTTTAVSSAITLQPDGRLEWKVFNFGGDAGAKKIYAVDTVSRGFEFDGTTLIPIVTGMTLDTPTHVFIHKNHLVFSFAGSVQPSGISTPFNWTILAGAAELAVGDTITNFLSQPGVEGNSSLAVFSRNSVRILYGSSSSDWNLVTYRDEVGGLPYSAQQLESSSLFFDDRGVADLRTTLAFGNFLHGTLSRGVQDFVNEHKGSMTASCIMRDKNQYRLMFSGGDALFITMEGKKVLGLMPCTFPDAATCMTSVEVSTGAEEVYFGASDGKVYQMEKGTSFDGDAIETFITTHFYASGTPRLKKKYQNAILEADGSGYTEFDFSYELGYASADISQPDSVNIPLELGSASWDEGVWDLFVWDGQSLTPSRAKMAGSAENVSVSVRSNSDYFSQLKLSGVQLGIQNRRYLR